MAGWLFFIMRDCPVMIIFFFFPSFANPEKMHICRLRPKLGITSPTIGWFSPSLFDRLLSTLRAGRVALALCLSTPTILHDQQTREGHTTLY